MNSTLCKRNRSGQSQKQRGAATIEFAVCLPIVVLIVFGSIEAANMMFLKQTLVQASYEGAKVAIIRESTSAETRAAIDAVLSGRKLGSTGSNPGKGVQGVQIQLDPEDVEAVQPGEIIRVTVSAPGGANSFLNVNPFQNTQVSVTACMVKE